MTFSTGPLGASGASIDNSLIPVDRRTTWQPGVTYNGGIPVRNTISTTLSPKGSATVTIDIATPGVIHWAGSPLSAGDAFTLETTGLLPGGITPYLPYYALSSGNAFQFSATNGGPAVNTTLTQSGTHTIFADDTVQINTAIAAASANTVVKLNAGTFQIMQANNNAISMRTSNMTLRGSGPGAAAGGGTGGSFTEFLSANFTGVITAGVLTASAVTNGALTVGQTLSVGGWIISSFGTGTGQSGTYNLSGGAGDFGSQAMTSAGSRASSALAGSGTGTFLIKRDRVSQPNYECIGIGFDANQWTHNINLTADAVKGTKTCTLASNPGITAGELVLIDHNTDSDPDVVWGPRHDPAGAEFIATIASNVLTVTQMLRGTIQAGVNMKIWAANVNVGTTVNSLGTGSGGTGTYNISATPNVAASQFMGAGFDTRAFFCRQDRSKNQIMRVSGVNGNTITFETPFHITFQTQYTAQLSRYVGPVVTGIGLEDFCVMGGTGGDGHGNIAMGLCTLSWIKHVEAYWSIGTSIGLYSTYRCELRDSYIHGTGDPNPGGGGYQTGINYGAADNLIENCIAREGNKEIVMRGTGGGNVVAYNYMDDAFGSTYPESPEAGINAAHFTTSHMELMEGNYSQNFKGDSFWGNSIYITVHRNHLSGVRAAHTPLDTYLINQGGTVFPYGDYLGRKCVDVQAYSFYHNFTGNVIGFNGQTLLSYSSSTFNITQNLFKYENLDAFDPDTTVRMWEMGVYQAPEAISQPDTFITDTYTTQLRMGNWDWFTTTQKWHGIGGRSSTTVPSKAIPSSYYLTNRPSFFGSNTWPWVDPATGAVATLPAKVRFDANTPNTVT